MTKAARVASLLILFACAITPLSAGEVTPTRSLATSATVSVSVPPITAIRWLQPKENSVEFSVFRTAGHIVVVRRSVDGRGPHYLSEERRGGWSLLKDSLPMGSKAAVTYEIWQF